MNVLEDSPELSVVANHAVEAFVLPEGSGAFEGEVGTVSGD